MKYIPNSEKHFDKLIKFLFLISTLSYIALSVFVSFAPYSYLLLIAIVFQGLGSLGLQPFECKALEEIAYPVKASLSVNGLFFMTCLLGFPISFISTIDGKKILLI